MEKLISVIVPVYNCEKTLSITIESIINQTYKNLEIILVDDGSKDNSGKICDEYAKLDSRINVIHQSNKGLSGARNTGINNSNGFYLSFVDAGDYVDLSMYEKLLPFVKKDIDLIEFPYYVRINEKNNPVINNCLKNKVLQKSFIEDEFIPCLLNLKCNTNNISLNFAVRILYKKSIIDKYGVYFDEKRRKWEDRDFIILYSNYCNSLVFFDSPLYYYICDDSQDHLSIKYFSSLLEECIVSCKNREKLFKDKYSFSSVYYLTHILNVFISRFFELIDHEDKSTVKEYIRKFIADDFVKSIFVRAKNVVDDKRLLKYMDCYKNIDDFYICLLKDKKSIKKVNLKVKILQFASRVKHKLLK